MAAFLSSDSYDYVFKLLLVGDSGVVKKVIPSAAFFGSHIQRQLYHDNGVDFKIRTVEIDGKVAKLQVWDTAGQERFRTITSSYYCDAHGVLLVYDVTNRESFRNVNMWLGEVDRYASPDRELILVGNQTDLSTNRQVAQEEGRETADRLSVPFVETSAKDGHTSADGVFMDITQRLISKMTAKSLVSDGSKPKRAPLKQLRSRRPACC